MNSSAKAEKRAIKKLTALVLCVVMLAAIPAALAGCAKEERNISLVEFEGTLKIEREGETLDAAKDMKLKSGDIIAPGEGGSARVRIDGDKFLYIESASRILLTAEGTAESSRTTVFVEKGGVMTEVKKKLSDDSYFNVVTPNTTMAIRGTKTITEVYEDILGAIKTNAAVVEGQVVFSTIQKDRSGKAVMVPTSLSVGMGFGVCTESKDLLSEDDVKSIADDGKTVDGQTAEETTHEELGSVLETPAFSDEFLTNIVAVLAKSRDEDIEEGFSAEDVSEEELNAAINILNDIIDGRIEIPTFVEEYIINQSQPYYSEPVVPDTPVTDDPSPKPETVDEPEEDDDTVLIDGTGESLVNITGDNDRGKVEIEAPTHVHSYVYHQDKAPTCVDAGWGIYVTCSYCDYTTYKEIDPLGHNFGEWTVKTAPYPVYEEGFLSGWHAGTKVRNCSRCSAKQEETMLAVPTLKNEFFGTVSSLPIDFFTDFGRNPLIDGMTLAEYGTECFWAASPEIPGDPYDTIDLPDAVIEWANGSAAVSSLKEGDTVKVKITVPNDLRDVYEDTVVTITLTGVHEHVWGEEEYIDAEHPLARCCELCGEIMSGFNPMN